jgi:two-component system, NtrC family, nitrogen regulation response regulator GlnG
MHDGAGEIGYTEPMPIALIVDDEQAVAWGLRRGLERAGFTAHVAATAEDGLKELPAVRPDAVFLDIRLPGMDGLTALPRFTAAAPTIVMTAHGDLDTAVRAVAGGAFDYLAKPFDLEQAVAAARRALDRGPGAEPEPDAAGLPDRDALVGRSPALQAVFKRIALVAPTDACVLITGESGTGKELVARAIHAHSPRRGKPFVPVHVAALNANLVESELFGHVKGAFTGADRAHPGLLVLAAGGTVFLDELGDIPPPVQAKLLRVLERREVVPVGGIVPVPADVRIVSATHADLSREVAAGRFRHDLFFRLNVYPIHIPALRDRITDVPILADFFLRRYAVPAPSIEADTLDWLASRPWPGNVRELRNACEHAAIEARGGPVRPEHFPAATPAGPADPLAGLVRSWVQTRAAAAGAGGPTDLYEELLKVIEPAAVGEVLRQVDGNRVAAARWLGLARATVRKLIRQHGLGADDADGEA